MKQFYLYTIAVLLVLVTATSCRDDFDHMKSPDEYTDSSFDEVFEAFWNGMNNNYVFWDTDPTDWDGIYSKYKPLFRDLDINDVSDRQKSREYFVEMTENLIDSHYTLFFTDETLESVMPSLTRKTKQGLLHPMIPHDYFYDRLDALYLSNTKKFSGDFTINGEDKSLTIVAGTIKDYESIVYIHFSGFVLGESFGRIDAITEVLNHFGNLVSAKGKNLKGIIIDIRSNGGGNSDDNDFFLGQLIDRPVHYGYTRSKGGNGRLDYTPWVPAILKLQPNSAKITAPIVAVADLYSFSMAEITTMAIKELPNGYFVGETTWGAHGPLIDDTNALNGGVFKSPFFESVYTSSLMFKNRDGQLLENKGVTPDIEVKYNETELENGIDSQLARAIQLIATGK